jgi:hypothetical protein
MKHHKNSRDAASPAPPSQQQTPIAAAFVSAPRQEAPFSTLRNSAPKLPAAPNIPTLRSSRHKVSNQRPAD